MAAHRTTSTTHWLNSIQSETDIIRPPQLPASPCCCGSESTDWTKQNLNCLLLLANVVFVQSLENCTVCTQHSLWLPNWIFYSVCFKSLVCLLKMDASCPWCKESSDKIQEKQKGLGSHLRYRVQKCEECVLQALQFISHTSKLQKLPWCLMFFCALSSYVCSMFSQCLIY